ncbi:hypothetical protein NLI96_g9229 [Meripilus lineatus]|uniref:Anaphase-promoting complex subunit 5 n=1 Tax=Meripilus lineatus TaxID=2056292 RepID=A0AAD5YD45_9APHY|nr:hypothetical protein NLI96_g9229 [Physisporinus lineatus]
MNMNRASHTPTPKPPSESRLPPTSHTLQPHHLQVLKLLSLVYHKYSDDQLPANFILHVYRVVLAEISEVRQPATYKEFVASVEEGAKATTPIAQKVLEEFKFVHTTILSPESISGFFADYNHLVPPKDDEDTRPFARRSIFGYFVRRTYVSFLKLSFEGVTQLYQDYIAWVAGDYTGSFITSRWRAEVDRSAHNIFKTEADRKQFAQPDTYALWEKEQATGNNAAAADHLRSFFEQHFHENSDSGLRQHAMLNLARMHMLRHEYPAAYKLLQEAIMVSRTNNDKSTLQHCTGLLHRIPRTDRTRPYTINEIQPDLHPLEVLSDTKKLLHVGSQQPLSASFERIVQSVALYDNWVDVQRATPVESEQWGQHAAQSVTWRTSGMS